MCTKSQSGLWIWAALNADLECKTYLPVKDKESMDLLYLAIAC